MDVKYVQRSNVKNKNCIDKWILGGYNELKIEY